MKNSPRPVTCSYRKVSKPLMEKKRRARINECLLQLKSLLEIQYSNSIRKRKLEKADILELTVKHLQNLQSSSQGSGALGQQGVAEFQSGFRSCLNGVGQYLLLSEASDQHLRLGILNHLVNSFPVFTGNSSSSSSSSSSSGFSPADADAGSHYVRIRPASVREAGVTRSAPIGSGGGGDGDAAEPTHHRTVAAAPAPASEPAPATTPADEQRKSPTLCSVWQPWW